MAQSSAQRPGTRRPNDRADRILDAASRLFCARGYHAVSLDDIGSAVGITGPAIYRHFANKEALLVAVNERMLDRLDHSYPDLSAIKSPVDRLNALIQSTMKPAVEGLDLWLIATSELRHLKPAMVRGVQKRRTAALKIWADALHAVHPRWARNEIEFMAEAGGGLASILLFHQPQLPQKRVIEILYRMVTAALTFPDDKAAPAVWRSDEFADAEVSGAGWRLRSSAREKILAISVPLFREHGFTGIGIDDIGAAAGVTGPAIYRHYKNKDEILLTAMNRASEQLAASVTRALARSTDAADALALAIEGYFDLIVNDTDLMAVFWGQRYALSVDARAAVFRSEKSYLDDLVGLLTRVRSDLPDADARAVVYFALGMMNTYWQSQLTLPPARAWALLQRMVWQAIVAS